MPPEDTTPSSYEYSSAENSSAESSSAESSGADTPSAGDASVPADRKPLDLQRSSFQRSGSQRPGSQPSGLQSSAPSRAVGSGISNTSSLQRDVDQLVRQALTALEEKRRTLQREVEQLEQRKSRLDQEMTSSFAGSSQEIAIRVQGFKDYLVGSLQDLVTAAEDMDLAPRSQQQPPADSFEPAAPAAPPADSEIIPFAAQRFAQQRDRVNSLLDQYRTRPDYYGPPWQLRRTFEPVHADRTANWFFTQGGRGSVKSMGSRLQNVLVASAAISCLHSIYDQRLCVLVLATTPERLGEWRRWLQDCLGIARADFGTNRGVMLFEASEPMAQRAERLLDSGRIPFLIMDEAEDKVSLSLLQYPLWLGFAPDPANPSTDYDYY
ncbi:MAG: DUF3086 domain-containing protein [Cyanobacteria bacterium J06634_5]